MIYVFLVVVLIVVVWKIFYEFLFVQLLLEQYQHSNHYYLFYHNNYLKHINFDNHYIDRYFYHIDYKRKAMNKIHLFYFYPIILMNQFNLITINFNKIFYLFLFFQYGKHRKIQAKTNKQKSH